jgi:hypothetical protein
VAQLETVVAGDGAGFARQSKLMQDGVHEITGAVASEGAAGAVGSMCTRGQAEDEDAGAGIAETWNRTRPVGLLLVGAAFRLTNTATVGAEAGTAFAGDDGVVDLLEEGRRKEWRERRHCISS